MADEPEIEAVREALAEFLKDELAVQFPACEFLDDWPQGVDLPELAVYVGTTGEATIEPHPPLPQSVIPDPAPAVTGTVTWAYGRAEGIQLELDAWANTQPKRDALALAIRRALNQAPQDTIPGADDGRPHRGHRANVTIPVPGLYGALFTFRFTQIPTIPEDSTAAQKNEWRSHWRGTADGALLDQDAGVVLTKKLHLTGTLGSKAQGQLAIAATRPRTQTITIVVPKTQTLAALATKQLKAYAVYDDGTHVDVTATAAWVSSDPGKAAVNTTGLVSAVATGTTNVTATSGGLSAVCTVTVS